MSALDLPLDAALTYGGMTALRATALLIGALLLATSLRRSSAAARHALWSVSVGALVILPALQWVLPAISIPVPWLDPAPAYTLPLVPVTPISVSAVHPPDLREVTPAEPVAASVSDAPALSGRGRDPVQAPQPAGLDRGAGFDDLASPEAVAIPIAGLLLLLWLIGGLAMAAPLAVGLWRAASLRRSAAVVHDGEWAHSLERARAAVGLTKPVAIQMSPETRTPMVGGVLRPFVLLPESARWWSVERREVVLLHELTHVKRGDALRQVIGRIAISLYWFHPLAWCAVRMAALAREEACDEAVLALGHRPSAYARHLLDLADPGPLPLPALSVFDRSHLEKRIMSILGFEAARRSFCSVLTASLLGGAWALTAAVAAPVEPRPSPALPDSRVTAAESQIGLANHADGETDGQVGGLGQPAEIAHRAAGDAVLDPFGEIVARNGPVVSALVQRRPNREDPEEACLPNQTRRGFIRGSVAGGDRTVVRRLGNLWICMWTQGFDSPAELAAGIQSLPRGAAVVLATLGEQGSRRLEMSAEPDGLVQLWFVNGFQGTFDETVREWRDTMLTIASGYGEIDEIRIEEARLSGLAASVRGHDARFRGEIASIRGGEARLQGESATARGEEARLRGEIARIRGQEAHLRGELARFRGVEADARGATAHARGVTAVLESRIRGANPSPPPPMPPQPPTPPQPPGPPPSPKAPGGLTPMPSDHRRMLDNIRGMTDDAETRNRLGSEMQALEGRLQEQQQPRAISDIEAPLAEPRRQLEEYQRHAAIQIAEIEAQIAALRTDSTLRVLDSDLASYRELASLRIAELEAQRAQLDVPGEVFRLEELIRGLEADRRIREIEQRIAPHARRLQEII